MAIARHGKRRQRLGNLFDRQGAGARDGLQGSGGHCRTFSCRRQLNDGEATALVGIHVSVAGSKISAEAIGSPIGPPTTSTFPEGSSVAVCVRQSRIVVIPAVERHEPVEAGAIYWHFVDVVWIGLFTAFYLLTR